MIRHLVIFIGPFRQLSDVSFVNMENSRDANVLVLLNDSLRVTWNPDTLFSSADPTTLRVDLHLSRFELNDSFMNMNRSVRVATLISNETNDGETTIEFPSILPYSHGVVAISIEVVLSGIINGSNNINGAVHKAKLWSRLFFSSNNRSEYFNHCQNWVLSQDMNIGELILSNVVACPRTIQQARTINSGVREDVPFVSAFRNFFHDGNTCFRQTNVSSG